MIMNRRALSKAKRNALARPLLLVLLGLGVVLVLSRTPSLLLVHAQDLDQNERVSLTGTVIDPQRAPIRDVEVTLLLNGEALADAKEQHGGPGVAFSQPDGSFVVDLPQDSIGSIETLTLMLSRPHFRSVDWEASAEYVERLNQGEALRLPDIELPRRVTAGFWVATITFLAILLLIALEKLHNTMAALLGVAVILGVTFVGGAVNPDLFIFDFDTALEYVNFDVIFLVLGMMIVIAVIEETGIFQWLAYQSYRLSGGRAWLLVIILIGITAVASAMLDNVTTMLLMTPITIQIALAMQMNPLALLLPEVLASNVGGISTLIGTPTNILIGAYAGFSFNDFLANLTPGVVAALVALTAYILLRYRKQLLGQRSGLSETLLDRLRESARIADAGQTAHVRFHLCHHANRLCLGRKHPSGAGGDGAAGRGSHVVVGGPQRGRHDQGRGLDHLDVLYRAVHVGGRHSGGRADQHYRPVHRRFCGRQPNRGHPVGSVVGSHIVRYHRQHPLHRRHAARGRVPHGHDSRRVE